YHCDWISNADKVRVIYWQLTGDKKSAANWLRHTPKPAFANNHPGLAARRHNLQN
ncbi:hypothetical protein MJM83_32080, partial [Salmonella enterica subsp. enterica serovar Montevideo]|nr:hypothetical protein [Salmonella enterica subsp. enterica serovar Montevideo]